jgi:hypothetical protein
VALLTAFPAVWTPCLVYLAAVFAALSTAFSAVFLASFIFFPAI